ncbi:hypothetical protein H312_02422 [Anncaliia algerae PRA339]|uniref:USP domain-containing protein n=1 Tax=Anncaliia algerae PRA339 TaxID=1288291 RepID=A0A059EZN7_9MICR|nr:hypothetical protein H312_02422 [Anncaliia algerae PRA339]
MRWSTIVADLFSFISPLPSLQKNIDKFCYGERENFITKVKSNFTIIYIPKILVLDSPEPVSLDRFNLKKHLKISFMKTQYELQSVGLYIPGEHQDSIPHYIAMVRKGNNLYKANDSIVTKFNLVDAKNTTDEHLRCLIYVRRE